MIQQNWLEQIAQDLMFMVIGILNPAMIHLYIYMNFEGHKLRGPVGYDEILTKQYGDYMTPPPVEKQVTHHSNKVYVHNVN